MIAANHPPLTPVGRVLYGVGQIGKNASSEVQKTFDTPPTVKVHSGAAVGILFTSDVKSQAGITANNKNQEG